ATEFEVKATSQAKKAGLKNIEIITDNPVPRRPFLGMKRVVDINPAAIFPYVNEQALFRGRWGYRRGKMSADEYKTLVNETVTPIYEDLKKRGIEEKLIQPKVTYGYFKCFRKS
ncbi:MAG: dihydropteroate synthase, partial [Planctomycetota bacterium]